MVAPLRDGVRFRSPVQGSCALGVGGNSKIPTDAMVAKSCLIFNNTVDETFRLSSKQPLNKKS
jgi:hypothetical protein